MTACGSVVTVAMKLAIFALFGLYSKLWRFVDQKDFETILKAVVVSSVGVIVFLFVFSIGKHDPPRGVLALDFLLSLAFVSGARFAVRWIVERPARGSILERAANEVLIVGAGNGGQQVAFELRRNPVRVEIDRVGAYLRGRTVLVTGAGGSIGAELCRQIARVGARQLVLVENSENALFEIKRELEEERHFARAASVLADCKDATRMREVFAEHRPSVVFHAAAYKHVPLMEENPVEAVRNNAVATRIVAAAAGEARTERFVLVSTDKAVSPATGMGASKALAEWAVEAAQNRWKGTRYSSVRFGNVLGSSGSVVPIFRRQIAKGGPVTVTDPRMTRYFMTIPEAVQLIIRAGSLSGSTGRSALYVLEMGEPVRI